MVKAVHKMTSYRNSLHRTEIAVYRWMSLSWPF